MLRLVYKSVENIVDLLPDVRAQAEELSVDPVQRRLEEVPLPGVLRVEEIQQLEDELVVDVALGYWRLKVLRFEKAQKEFVDKLQMRPGRL